ncbi:MAG: chemotaxis protein CheX [Acetobacteraceae bacterium]
MDELEHDALTELLNISVSRAAASLRTMIGRQVLLSVPAVAIVTQQTAMQMIGERESSTVVAVQQMFEGDLSGQALLIFPETNSLELVRAVAGSMLSLEDIIDLEQEALAETGNIILNGCLATIANLLHRNLKISLPEILRGSGPGVFAQAGARTFEDAVLFLFIDFSVNERDIRGYIAMLMDLPALTSLKGLLGEFIRRASDEGPATHHAQR